MGKSKFIENIRQVDISGKVGGYIHSKNNIKLPLRVGGDYWSAMLLGLSGILGLSPGTKSMDILSLYLSKWEYEYNRLKGTMDDKELLVTVMVSVFSKEYSDEIMDILSLSPVMFSRHRVLLCEKGLILFDTKLKIMVLNPKLLILPDEKGECNFIINFRNG